MRRALLVYTIIQKRTIITMNVLMLYPMDEYLRHAVASRTRNSNFPLNVSVHHIPAHYPWTERELYGNGKSDLST